MEDDDGAFNIITTKRRDRCKHRYVLVTALSESETKSHGYWLGMCSTAPMIQCLKRTKVHLVHASHHSQSVAVNNGMLNR